MPAIQGSQAELQQVMRDATRSATAAGHVTRMRGVLVVGEFALALVLLVGAALLIQSFWRLQHVTLGFNPESVLTARLWLPQPNDPQTGPYFTHDARVAFYRRVLDRLSALPGVQSVGGISTLPLSGPQGRLSFAIEGRSTDIGDAPSAQTSLVTPGYFRDARDRARARPAVRRPRRCPHAAAAVVSESFARQFFADDDPIGKRIDPGVAGAPGGPQQPPPNAFTIVGIVRDVKTDRLDTRATPMLYRSVLQPSNLNLTLVVRAQGDPSMLDRIDPARGARGRSQRAGVQRADDGRRRGGGAGAAAVHDAVAGAVRRDGAVVVVNRHLRRDGVLRHAADARDRDSDGARGCVARRAGDGAGAGRASRGGGRRGRSHRRVRAHARHRTLLFDVSPRDPMTLRVAVGDPDGRRAARVLRPGAAGDAGRSDPRAEIRMSIAHETHENTKKRRSRSQHRDAS